ncbi:MAG TPA: NRDE family protein [Kofleriaceae bacterium]|nr:NRDE family protein [Kofleriaceae bacterium]
MCTIAFLIGVAEHPLVIAANRDELYARPTRPPERLAPHVVGGVDARSGGTWLAIHARGSFAAVTNQRALATPPPELRSRGLAVRELASADDPDAYVAALDPRGYASMNLAWGDARGVTLAYLRHDTGAKDLVRLGHGVHVLCNDRLGAPGFPRGVRLAAAIKPHLAAPWPELASHIAIALGDHTQVPPPPSHLPLELARALTATCIHSPLYGTRSATIAAFAPGRVVEYLDADGPPCTTPFVDLRGLLGAA